MLLCLFRSGRTVLVLVWFTGPRVEPLLGQQVTDEVGFLTRPMAVKKATVVFL